jgi:hypothetical protein
MRLSSHSKLLLEAEGGFKIYLGKTKTLTSREKTSGLFT